jgi:predicted amidohydrolase YtcJ
LGSKRLGGKRISFKSYFDKYFPDVPVVLNRVDGHAIVNSKVLAMANITKDTKVSGGQIEIKTASLLGY